MLPLMFSPSALYTGHPYDLKGWPVLVADDSQENITDNSVPPKGCTLFHQDEGTQFTGCSMEKIEQDTTLPSHTISTARLWDDIMETAKFGAMEDCEGGMSRLALSEADRMVREWFKLKAQLLGCEVKVDQVGNMFAVFPGTRRDLPPIGIGSHLDTQPAGGRFDGILGVLGGLEVLRTIKSSGRQMYCDIAVINWTNEEGPGYQSGCTGSAVWSGHVPLSKALSMHRADGQGTFETDLRAIAYQGPVPATCLHNQLSAHFELHIEQGRRLEDSGKKLGVVTNIQGIRWYMVEVRGRRAHAGSTPMESRADALVAASEIVCFLNRTARDRNMVATVGVLQVDKASSNIVPDKVNFTIDLRHTSEELLCCVERDLTARMKELSLACGSSLVFHLEQVWHSPAAHFDKKIVDIVERAVSSVVHESNVIPDMTSFAGHDSALVHLTGIPTAMIFVPSRAGISHAPEEFTERDQCGDGVTSLFRAVCLFDESLRLSDLGQN